MTNPDLALFGVDRDAPTYDRGYSDGRFGRECRPLCQTNRRALADYLGGYSNGQAEARAAYDFPHA